MAGTIGAIDDGNGVVGVAPGARLHAVKVLDSNGSGYEAIQGAVDAGVAFAVAAGNSDADTSGYSPAAFDNVLTVSALADFNGLPGGGAATTCRHDQDDTLADFSNWGNAVQIAAPGVCSATGYKVKGVQHVDLSWSGARSTYVDLYRNGSLVTRPPTTRNTRTTSARRVAASATRTESARPGRRPARTRSSSPF